MSAWDGRIEPVSLALGWFGWSSRNCLSMAFGQSLGGLHLYILDRTCIYGVALALKKEALRLYQYHCI